jgi:hypothetical protein
MNVAHERRRTPGLWIVLATLSSTLSAEPAPTDAEADFKARAAQPDVILAVSFDTAADVDRNIFPNGAFYASGGGWDKSVKASGAGAMRFVIQSKSAAGGAGSWRINFPPPPARTRFGANTEFYVQWRQRFSRTLLETGFQDSAGFKQIIIGPGDYGRELASCSELEIVVQNTFQRGFPQMYHSCGTFHPLEERLPDGDLRLQNAAPSPYCLYRERADPARCFRYVPDEWMTFQVHVKPGPRGRGTSSLEGPDIEGFTDSTVQMWAAREHQPSVLIHDWKGLVLRETDGLEYGKVWLLPYQSDKNASQVHADAYTWYDELIISKSRLADPR